MEDDFVAVHKTIDERGIAYVAADEIDLLSNGFRKIVQPAVAVEGVVLGKSRYFAARGNRSFCQLRPDTPCRSRHESLCAGIAGCHDARLIVRFGPRDDTGAGWSATPRQLPRPPEGSSQDRKQVSCARNRRGRSSLLLETGPFDRTLQRQARRGRACFHFRTR